MMSTAEKQLRFLHEHIMMVELYRRTHGWRACEIDHMCFDAPTIQRAIERAYWRVAEDA